MKNARRNLEEHVFFRHIEAEEKPSKKSKKGSAKGSVALLKDSTQLVCVSQDSCPRKICQREKGILGSKHAVNVSKGTWHQIKIRERKGGFIQKCEPHECSPCAPKFGERSHEEALHQERCARRVAWDLAKSTYKLKNSDKATFFAGRARIRSRFRSVNARDEQKRIKLRRDGYFAKIPEHHCGAHIQWRGAYKRGSTKLFDEWVSSQKPRVTKEEKTIICKTDNFVLLVVPGLSTRSGSNSSSTSTCQQVQPKSEVTIGQQETVAIQFTSKKKHKKRGTTIKHRETDCGTFWNG